MKTTVYMRVAWDKDARRKDHRRPRYMADQHPCNEPIYTAGGIALPTVSFAVELDLPDAMFERAATVIAELAVSEEEAEIGMQVRQR